MSASKRSAEILAEFRPDGDAQIHGVTLDGTLVWFARTDEILAFDPETATVVRRLSIPGAYAGTAFDGEHLYQLARGEVLVIRPADGRIVRRFPSPAPGNDSGMAWADGHLWIGHYGGAQILKVDAETGDVVKTLRSDRFVTGVSWVDGALFHGVSGDGMPCEIRRVASDGTVEETIEVPVPSISGMEGAGDGTFWCGGEKGALRLVRGKRERVPDPAR